MDAEKFLAEVMKAEDGCISAGLRNIVATDPPEQATESWRVVFRDGLAPQLSDNALAALERGLAEDDPTLMQGCTTTPPPLMAVQDWPVAGGDFIAYAGWKGEGLVTVGETEEFFAKSCFEIDQRLGEPAACRWFLNWGDNTPRPEAFSALLGEVRREIAKRKEQLP